MTSTTNRARPPANSPLRWDAVDIGDAVEIRINGRNVFGGLVDARTEDGDVVWVTAAAGARRMFHVADGFELAGVPA
ncbi:hypothetical protein [Pseudarthrobacter enclensis]|uniref:Uncharacterized protein n=1 Tax=Pseudarthrobacter enclensis TaxID=993070 RepID=A0ABT9RUV2_9MICC|nr:hypothetical protein [Pseudarthrobacter enclensis]MDP9888428.1 hypothetical protein [Pseudarthrobacter enclensis]